MYSKNNKSSNNIVGLPRIMKYLFFEDKRIPISYIGISKAIRDKKFSKKQNDYGLLVLEKETGYSFGGSLLRIKKIDTNPTNGFQFKQIESIDRKKKESKDFIINNYKTVLKKRAEPYLIFKE